VATAELVDEPQDDWSCSAFGGSWVELDWIFWQGHRRQHCILADRDCGLSHQGPLLPLPRQVHAGPSQGVQAAFRHRIDLDEYETEPEETITASIILLHALTGIQPPSGHTMLV
jgi:hypothetical protein